MPSLNFDVARDSMIKSQMRTWYVHDERVLDLIARMPRQDYMPAASRNLAYVDMNIPLGHGEVMMNPKIEARLVQELEIVPTDKILEIGTGSGYMTALLANLGRHVVSVELRPEFTAEAATKLAHHGVRNITLEVGDGARGWDRQQPYDVILITGSLPILPAAFRETLAPGGRMIAIVGQSPAMEVKLIRRTNGRAFNETSLFETDLPPLRNAIEPARFVF
ncbi:MAG: protein-L-isoaspartate O-methyltransferase [Sulfuricaulis sp.]|nr:protein-L-isoaspartate O-methyltransferase [Sulfuricaulis sp.]